MPTTYKAIATVTVGSGGAADIQFTSIPGTYTDLVVVASARTDAASAAGATLRLDFNGSSANRSSINLIGTGSAVLSTTSTVILTYLNNSDTTSNTFGNGAFYITNYTSSNNKSLSVDGVFENNATNANQLLSAGLWSQTAAITSIKLYHPTGNLVEYSTATLYGIKNS